MNTVQFTYLVCGFFFLTAVSTLICHLDMNARESLGLCFPNFKLHKNHWKICCNEPYPSDSASPQQTLRICMPQKLLGARLMFCSGICILE